MSKKSLFTETASSDALSTKRSPSKRAKAPTATKAVSALSDVDPSELSDRDVIIQSELLTPSAHPHWKDIPSGEAVPQLFELRNQLSILSDHITKVTEEANLTEANGFWQYPTIDKILASGLQLQQFDISATPIELEVANAVLSSFNTIPAPDHRKIIGCIEKILDLCQSLSKHYDDAPSFSSPD